MDGLAQHLPLTHGLQVQRTLKAAIGCVGTGLHSGCKVQARLLPAPPGHGIRFCRSDLGTAIPARFDHVADTRLSTTLGAPDAPAVRIATVEHVLAALAGAGITNAIVEVDGPEMPIHDGSAAGYAFLVDCAGTLDQAAFAPAIEVLRPVRVTQGAAFAELRPGQFGLDIALSIEFEAAAIGRQSLALRLSPETFRAELARARTFALSEEVEQLREAGLAQGGSLANAVVVDGDRVLNPGGLRMRDEFVRHKVLDAVGDLALAGAPLLARFIAHRTGHALNNRLLHALFADPSNWRFAPAPSEAQPVTMASSIGGRVAA
jgi:UDP-3-O-[3-hydroxymyristoyl] N-acetylglucosamine deacetylase